MKKVLIFLFAIVFLAAGMASADSVRSLSLSQPLLLTDDTSILKTYPGALQMFPTTFWMVVSQTNEYSVGFAYVQSDLFGIALNYTFDDTLTFAPAALSTDEAASAVILGLALPGGLGYTTHLGLISYGVKFGSLCAGLAMENSFVDQPLISQSVDSNARVLAKRTLTGIRMAITPSVAFSADKLKVFASLPMDLDMMKYRDAKMQNKKGVFSNELVVAPALFRNFGVDLLGSFQLSDTVTAGAGISFGVENQGYSVKVYSNYKQLRPKSVSNVRYQKVTTFGVTLGLRAQPSEKGLLFIDLPFKVVDNGVGAYWGTKTKDFKLFKTKSATWTIPTPKFGGEVELWKNVKFRLSAAPSWTVTKTRMYNMKDIPPSASPYNFGPDTYNYSITPAIGVGYKWRNLSLNAGLEAEWFTTTVQNPLRLLSGIFNNTSTHAVGTDIFGLVQLNYVFASADAEAAPAE